MIELDLEVKDGICGVEFFFWELGGTNKPHLYEASLYQIGWKHVPG